jgi:hypothetical protein
VQRVLDALQRSAKTREWIAVASEARTADRGVRTASQ